MRSTSLPGWLIICVLTGVTPAAFAQNDDNGGDADFTEGQELVETEVADPDVADQAPAEPAEPAEGFSQVWKLQARINPLGLSLLSDLSYRFHPYPQDSLITQGTRVDVGLSTRLSPSFIWVGPYVEAVPISFLKIRALARPVGYFGTYGFIYDGFERDDPWDEDTLDAIEEEGLGQAASGWQVYLEPTLQLKLGPIVLLHAQGFMWQWMRIGGDYYYEPLFDFLMARNDLVWSMRSTLGYLIGDDPSNWYLLVAVRHSRWQTFESDFLRQQLGGMLIWQLPRTWIEWGRPSLVIIVQNYLQHPMRQGEMIGAMQIQLTFPP